MKKYSTIIGMDLGDKESNWALMVREEDELQEEGVVRTTRQALERKFGKMEPALVAIEAGTHSPWVSRLLEECGHEVLVGNPRKLRAIYQNERKSDKMDARMLARLARMDPELLYPIQHRGRQAQAHLAVMQAREALVKSRTALVNHVRNMVKSWGERLASCGPASFARKVAGELPEALEPALGPVVATIGELSARIDAYDKEIESLCAREYPETDILRDIQGVGPLTSLGFVLTLETPERFANSRDVAAFVGLVPRRDQSGGHDPQLRITKTGNKYLRKLLVQAAQHLIGKQNTHESELRQWGLRLAGPLNKQGKHNKRLKKRAVVAVARKLAVLLHRLWSTGECYDPFYYENSRKQMTETS